MRLTELRKELLLAIILVMVLAAISLFLASATDASPDLITVSGVITGPSGVVEGAWVGVGSPQDWVETASDASGFYSASIETNGQIRVQVRPDIATRLTQANQGLSNVTSDVVLNFTVENGYLLEMQVTGGGAPLNEQVALDIQPLINMLTGFSWYQFHWDGGLQRYQAVLPPDVYYVTVARPPSGYFATTQAFDLRTSDVLDTLALSTSYVHPLPYDPPVASKITIGPVGDLGEATISGSAGAALPLANVLFINLNAGHQSHTVSEADGSFSGRLFAPPGSSIMIKHGPASFRWNDLATGVAEMLNPFPGTIVTVPHAHTVDTPGQAFAAAGAVAVNADDKGDTPNTLGAAWAISGTVEPVQVDGQWTRVLTGTYQGQSVAGLYLGGLNWTAPALGDLDDDNDLDLLVGAEPGRLVFFRNMGDSSNPDWRFESADYGGASPGDGWAYPLLADLNDDGLLDLAVGQSNGLVSLYYNEGTASVAAWPAYPSDSLTTGSAARPTVTDLDGDNLLDIVVGQNDGRLFHFENSGSAASPVWTKQSENYAGINEGSTGLQPAFVNLDGDTDLDLLLGLCGQLIWYERTGSTPPWTRHEADPIGHGGGSCNTSPAVGDWNGDTRPDLVTGEHWGYLRFFLADAATVNDIAPTWSEHEPFAFPFELGGDTAPALADWDDDGDLDMLVGQAHGAVEQYTNVGDKNAADWQAEGTLLELPWVDHPHPFPALADIDGDNDYDLFVGEGGWQGPGAGGNIRHYENVGDHETPDWQLVTTDFLGLDVGGWSTPSFADINGDLDLDLFVGAEDGSIVFVENTGTPVSPTWGAPVMNYAGLALGERSAPTFLDIDQDNDLDMLVGLAHGSMAYVRNVGDPTTPNWEVIADTYPGINIGQNATPTAADLNGDSLLDLMIGDWDGGLNLYLYDGPGSPPTAGEQLDPGDLLRIEGTIHLYSQAITPTTNVESIDVFGALSSHILADDQGKPLPTQHYFVSSLLTPSGLPIQRSGQSTIGWGEGFSVSDLHYAGGHAISGHFSIIAQVPVYAPAGQHRPAMFLHFNGVPAGNEWISANVTRFTYSEAEALLPPIQIASSSAPKLHWRLLMDDIVQGTRGAASRDEMLDFGIASQIVTQGAPFVIPLSDIVTSQPITYRLEPFLPRISYTDRRMPGPPLLPFALPGGELCVAIHEPDGGERDLGCEAFAQSFNRTKTTRGGLDLNSGTVQLDDVYSLKAASDRFRVTFEEYGHHVITMTGVISDIWGNAYQGGGTYDVWLAEPLDMDPGVLPGTPLAAGDAFNPAMQFYPQVPAKVSLTISHYPDSNPASKQTFVRSGQANDFGYFSLDSNPIVLTEPGEYRVDVSAVYTATDGTLYMGAMTWGSIVMTPDNEADLLAHGRRGLDSLGNIPSSWFVASRDLTIPQGAISHTFNPYFNGDILWSRMSDGPYGGDSLVLGASVQEKTANGPITTAIKDRYQRAPVGLETPGDIDQRVANNELPLFISTLSGQPPQFVLRQIGTTIPGDVDQIAYSYRSSQRPGVRVREVIAEEGQNGGYWRLDTLYDDQLSVGVLGDQVNDFKFQYIGAVFRDLSTGKNEYLGQGSGWIFIPDSDQTGSRVMPPFEGLPDSGPILVLKGEEIHIFILPTGVLPGAVLEVGDTFHFGGHIMPTLDSQVAVTVTAPSGVEHLVGGQANSVGYFYDPADDFTVNEAGLWTVDVKVWHDGQFSVGSTSPPYPSGDVLGSENGRYAFYVAPANEDRLSLLTPRAGLLNIGNTITPIVIKGPVPAGLSDVTVDYTITMPGYILDQGHATISGGTFSFTYDPATLSATFPNLDLVGRDDTGPGLADTITIGLLLQGSEGSQDRIMATVATLQGERVYTVNANQFRQYLPALIKGSG